MGYHPVHVVSCDHDNCPTPPVETVAGDAVHAARAAGWSCTPGGDLCPDHRTDWTADAHTTRPATPAAGGDRSADRRPGVPADRQTDRRR